MSKNTREYGICSVMSGIAHFESHAPIVGKTHRTMHGVRRDQIAARCGAVCDARLIASQIDLLPPHKEINLRFAMRARSPRDKNHFWLSGQGADPGLPSPYSGHSPSPKILSPCLVLFGLRTTEAIYFTEKNVKFFKVSRPPPIQESPPSPPPSAPPRCVSVRNARREHNSRLLS